MCNNLDNHLWQQYFDNIMGANQAQMQALQNYQQEMWLKHLKELQASQNKKQREVRPGF